MLLTLMILQVITLQLLSQTHQQVMAQLNHSKHSIPVNSTAYLEACLRGQCKSNTHGFELRPLVASQTRQFYSATLRICENKECFSIEQVISGESAILKEGAVIHTTVMKTEA
jgi:hypothetical protein